MEIVIFMALWIFLWLLPFILVAKSNKTSGSEKLVWLLALFFISWFAWIFYIFLAPMGEGRTK